MTVKCYCCKRPIDLCEATKTYFLGTDNFVDCCDVCSPFHIGADAIEAAL